MCVCVCVDVMFAIREANKYRQERDRREGEQSRVQRDITAGEKDREFRMQT